MYTPDNLNCILPSLDGTAPGIWSYKSTDAAAVVAANGYITDAKARGLRVDDIVYVYDTDAVPRTMTTHTVMAINADGSADLSNAGATHGTNSG